MAATETDIRAIDAIIAPLLGTQAWGASLGYGSLITVEFGASIPDKDSSRPPHGEWHLWVTYCAWRLETESEVMVGSEDTRADIQESIQQINGLPLNSVALTLPALETTFAFEGGVALRLFPVYTREAEHWQLWVPDGNVLTVGPGSAWSFESGDLPPAAAARQQDT